VEDVEALPRLAPWQGWQLERDLHYERIEGAEHNEAAWPGVSVVPPIFGFPPVKHRYNPRSLFEARASMLAARLQRKTMSPIAPYPSCVSPLTKRAGFSARLQGLGLHGLSFDCRETTQRELAARSHRRDVFNARVTSITGSPARGELRGRSRQIDRIVALDEFDL